MKTVKQSIKIDQLHVMDAKKSLDFNFVIQRKEDIWDHQRKSFLIQSILTNYPINPTYAIKSVRTYSIIDGKQRLSTILSYIRNGFELDKHTPPVGNVSIESKKFNDLPEDMQETIMNYKIDMLRVEEATMDEIEDLFFRLNNGVALKQIETTRAILGGRLLKDIERIANTPFFAEKVNLSKASRKRFADQELILQILALIHKEQTGLSSKEIRAFVKELRKTKIQKKLMTKLENASYFLNVAFPNKEKFLRKLHVPAIYMLALENQENGTMISSEVFGEWCKTFFANVPESYYQASQSGSAKKENVQTRLNEMKKHFVTYFQKVNTRNKNTETIPSTSEESLTFVMRSIDKPDQLILKELNHLTSTGQMKDISIEKTPTQTNTTKKKEKEKSTTSKKATSDKGKSTKTKAQRKKKDSSTKELSRTEQLKEVLAEQQNTTESSVS